MNSRGVVRIKSDQHIADLRAACDYFGASKGRAQRYAGLFDEYVRGARGREHILGINESFEVVEIFRLWRDHLVHFPGLRQRIREALEGGPVVTEDEKTETASNRSRNDVFVFNIAGRLLSGGMRVISVDGIPRTGGSPATVDDIQVQVGSLVAVIECKRPRARKAMVRRVREAARGIAGRHGAVAVDCSVFIRPPNKLYECDSERDGQAHLQERLNTAYSEGKPIRVPTNIMGLILYARMPTMARLGRSPIVTQEGVPFVTSFRPGSVMALDFRSQRTQSSDPHAAAIFDALRKSGAA